MSTSTQRPRVLCVMVSNADWYVCDSSLCVCLLFTPTLSASSQGCVCLEQDSPHGPSPTAPLSLSKSSMELDDPLSIVHLGRVPLDALDGLVHVGRLGQRLRRLLLHGGPQRVRGGEQR